MWQHVELSFWDFTTISGTNGASWSLRQRAGVVSLARRLSVRCVWVRCVRILLSVTSWLLGYDPDEQKMVGGLTLPVLMSDVKIRNEALICWNSPATDVWTLRRAEGRFLIKSSEVRGKGELTGLKCSKIQANLDAPGLSASSPHCSAN